MVLNQGGGSNSRHQVMMMRVHHQRKKDWIGLDSPTLVREAIEAGFTVNQICQAEQELSSPSPATPMASKHLKEGSIAKRIIDVWVGN
jgi:hypothetical protein